MLKSYFHRWFAGPNGTAVLVRRLLAEQAAGQWRRYALAFGLMGIAAASTALGAYLVGDVINQAYVHKNLTGIVILALATAVIFMIKGMATYGQAVMLARIGNRIIAHNQREMFAKLLRHNIGFFADRHSSEFMARLAYRSGPLMEALGGFAIAGALVYGGFRVIETGATPGQFSSFLAAFMLAYEPAKRLARFNLDLNSGLVGVRILFDVVDHPPTEPAEDGKPPLKLARARVEFANVQFAYRPGEKVIK